jgi:glutaredoxin
MTLLRFVIGRVILFFDWLFTPQSMQRPVEAQRLVDQATAGLILYQLPACPFCVKVRRAIKRLGLKIEIRNVDREANFREELVREGGKFQAPCLRIDENAAQTPISGGDRGVSQAHEGKECNQVRWMYESSDIVAYLDRRFGAQ